MKIIKCRHFLVALAATVLALPATRTDASDFFFKKTSDGTWDTTNTYWSATQSGSPTLLWQDGSTNRAFLDAGSFRSRTVTLNEDGIAAQTLLIDGGSNSSANQTWSYVLATPQDPKTLTLNGGGITFNFLSGNNVGVLNAQIDANISAVDATVDRNPVDLTVLVAGTDTTASAFGNTTLTLNGANTFKDLHIGGGIKGAGSAAPANTVFIQNSAGIAATSNVYLDTNNAGNGANTALGGACFAIGTSTGSPVNAAINNLILNNSGTYSSTQFFRVGAAQFTQLDINGAISGPGDLTFAAGFSGGAGTVVLHSQSTYGSGTNGAGGSTTTFNMAGSSATGPGLVQLAIDDALPTATKLVWGFNTNGNGGTLDLNGHNQTIASLVTAFGAGNSVITNNAQDTTSVLTINGSNSPGAFNLPIVDGLGDTGIGKVAIVRAGTGTTFLANPNNGYTGGTTILGGTLSIGSDSALGNPLVAGNSLVINGGTLALSGSLTLNAGRAVLLGPTSGAGTGTISVASGANATFNGVIGDNGGMGGLTLSGPGTLTLGGTNTYSGPTLVNSGTLALQTGSSLNTASNITVATGAILAGSGTVGSVTVNGTIAPGSTTQPGSLAVSSLTLSGGGVYNWKLGNAGGEAGTGWDLISVNGGAGVVTLNNTSGNKFTINLLGPNISNFDDTQSYTWPILSAGSFAGTPFNANLFNFNTSAFPGSDPGSSFSLVSPSDGSLSIVYTPGPTPLVWKSGAGGTGNWSNSAGSTDWSSGPWTPGGSAAFNQGSGTVTLTEPISTVGMRFNVGGYTIVGSGANTLASPSFSVTNTADVVTIAAEITGNSGLTLRGAGTLILAGPNSYTGTTSIVSGTLQATTANLPTDVVNNSTLIITQTANGAFTHALSGSGRILVDNQNNSVLTLSGANTATGPLQINSGVVSIDSDARLGTSTSVTLNGGTLRFSADILSTVNPTTGAYVSGGVTRTINVGDGFSTPNTTIDTGAQRIDLAGGTTTSPQIILNNSGTLHKAGTGELRLINSGFTHPSGSPPGTVVVDQGTLTLGDPRNQSADPSTFMGPTGLGNNLVVNEGATIQTAATSTGTASLNSLNSLTINGGTTGVTYVINRTTGGGALSQSPSFTMNGTTGTPVTLGGLFTINAAGNISANTPRLTFGALTLTADTTIQCVSNATFSTNLTTTGLFTDNGHSLTFYGQGSGTQLPGAGFRINSNPGGSVSVVTGNWILGSSNAAAPQGCIVSYGGSDNTSFTTGNITVNNFSQLQFFSNNFTFGTPTQTLTLNGIGNELADTNTSFDGALSINSGNTNTYKGNIVLASDSIINATNGSTTPGRLTLTGTITGPGTLKKSGSGELIILSSANTAAINTIVRNGTITVGDGSSVGAGNAILPPGNLTLAATSSGGDTVNFRNQAETIADLASSFTASTGTISQSIKLTGTDQGGTVLTINETGNTSFGAGAVATLTSKITGVGSIVLGNSATGALTFTGTNDYNGGTTINGGKLALAGGTNVGAIFGGDVAINANGILGVNTPSNLVAGNPNPPMGANTNATALINSGGTMSIDSDFDASALVDPASVGILALNGTNSTLTGTNGSSAFIGAFGSQSLTSTSLAPGAGGTYRLGGRGGTLTVTNGVLAGAGNSLIIGSTQPNGFGGVVLAAANTFGGGTSVNNGSLRTTANGALGSGGLTLNNATGTTASASVESNETVSSLASTASGGAATLSIAAGKTLTDNQSTNTTFAGTMTNNGTLAKGGSGTLEITAAPVLNSASALIVNDTGKLKFNVNTGSPFVGTGVTAMINNSAVLELAGSVSALDPVVVPKGRADVVNNSTAAAGLLVTGQNQQVGGIDGSGTTQVNGDSQLTANHIVQGALLIGGSDGHPSLVTIAPSDDMGAPLASLVAGAGLGTDTTSATLLGATPPPVLLGTTNLGTVSSLTSPLGGGAAAVPEPSTLVLGAMVAIVAVFAARRRLS